MTGRPPQDHPQPQGAALQPGILHIGAACLALSLLAGCNPTVKVEAPDKPIVINLNVKIEQEVRIRVDKDVDNLVSSNPNIF
ncbi:MAG: YnbE family lipoprotein [Rhodospirillaceae bacterium]|nr:YnbE family lipoprotein [Rhodospirillaceae bacterium]